MSIRRPLCACIRMQGHSHMKTFITIFVIAVIAVALVAITGTVTRAVVYVPDSGVVDVTAADFVPNNLGPVAIVKVVTPIGSATSSATILAQSTSTPKKPTSVVPTTPKPVVKPPAEYPAKIIIPTIAVNASIQTVGLTAHGSIGTPNNFTDVAWYVYGPVPGRQGTAIFDGHVDNGLGMSGVFKNLASLKVGDDIEVVTNGGTHLHFTVASSTSYDYRDVPATAMFSASGPSQIVLISCEGNWVGAEKTYDRRLIVTAMLKG